MIQELISTSAPRCLNGNAGFGIVAQTRGMAANVSQAVNALSGYTHVAAPGSGKNPVVYLHAIRRTGGMLRHIVSRIADCGNDYSGRSNRIAHHWIIEEEDVRLLSGGPGVLHAQNTFHASWKGRYGELPPRKLIAADISMEKCTVWEQLTGDAGWGGIVAERAEKGDPISIIFTSEHNSENLRTLLSEALALLPPQVRWNVTFSTYYMKSHESSGDKIQLKCFLAGSEEAAFVRQSPNTLVIDLREQLPPAPAGKYVEQARGAIKSLPKTRRTQVPMAVPLPEQEMYGIQSPSDPDSSPLTSTSTKKSLLDYRSSRDFSSTEEDETWWQKNMWYVVGLVICLLIVFAAIVGRPLVEKIIPKNVVHPGEQGQFNPQNDNNGDLEKLRKELEIALKTNDDLKREREQDKETWETTNQALEKKNTDLVKETERDKLKLNNEIDALKKREADRLSLAEKELNKQQQKDREQQEIAENLKKLPPIWLGLAPEDATLVQPKMIEMEPEFYRKYREKIKLDTVHFVNLESGAYKIVKVKDESEQQIIFKSNGDFAKIELTDEGVRFEWLSIASSASGARDNQMRILLSTLRMTVGDYPCEITLWTPLKVQQDVSSTWRETVDDSDHFSLEFEDTSVLGSLRLLRTLFDGQLGNAANPLGQLGEMTQVLAKRIGEQKNTETQKILEQAKIYLLHPDGNDKLLLLEGGK